MTDDRPADSLTYDAAITEVEQILAELEASIVDVDHLAERIARASMLLEFCRSRLEAVQVDVEHLVAELEPPTDPGGSDAQPDDD